jgi:hypothetical protein
MKCARCAAEVPGQAQFCMKCGAPVSAGRPGPTVTVAHTRPVSSPGSSKTGKIAALSALALLLCIAAFFGIQNLLARNASAANAGRLTDLNGRAMDGSGLLDKNGRIADTGNLTDSKGKVEPGPADPVDVIDYLKHVRQIERERLNVYGAQKGRILALSAAMTADPLKTVMDQDGDWQAEHKKTYEKFTAAQTEITNEWQTIAQHFNGYPKPVPASCTALRDHYLTALGKSQAEIAKELSLFTQALGGDSTSALEGLTKMQGASTRTGGIDEAYDKADAELANVCAKYNLHKDFDIKADGGAANPFGVGR